MDGSDSTNDRRVVLHTVAKDIESRVEFKRHDVMVLWIDTNIHHFAFHVVEDGFGLEEVHEKIELNMKEVRQDVIDCSK